MNESLRLQARAALLDVRSGGLRGAALRARILAVPACDRDVWADELLGLEDAPPDAADLPRGSVPYLPCGIDEILALVQDVPLRRDDEFVDLGSGLGRVAILVHLLSGARAAGIEIQEPLVRGARAACARLALDGVSFVHCDAAGAALDGSVFFLYAPFNGPLLRAVLRRLEDVARRRAVVIGAVGLELQGLEWLRRRASSHVSLALYDSCVCGVARRSP